MRHLGRLPGVTRLLALLAAAMLTVGCGPSARDMPVVIVPDGVGGAVVLYPLCEGASVRSLLVSGSETSLEWRVAQADRVPSAEDGIGRLHFEAHGFDATTQLPRAKLVADTDSASIRDSFYALHGLDLWAGDGEAYMRVSWLTDRSSPQWVLGKIPYHDGDIEVETVTEQEGRQRLLAWCDS